MKSKITFLIFPNLLIINILTAQKDSIEPVKPIDLSEKTLIKTSIKSNGRDRATFTFTIGTRSLFYPEEKNLDGTNKVYIKNVNTIPMSFKAEFFLKQWFSMGFSINHINNQRIYDAMWHNGYKGITQVHRFTIIQKRTSFLWRNNFYFVNHPKFQFYLGAGVGFASYKHIQMVVPDSYEYGGSGETDFLYIIGLELSAGLRYFPLKDDRFGVFAEGGLMQSFGRFGMSYRLK